MNYLSIDLYNDFECIAGNCPNTCCAGWGIIIDEDTRQKMVEKEAVLGVPAKDWLKDVNGTTFVKLAGHKCSMLNENNLCNVVLKLGPEYLSKTCQQYPRLLVKYGNVIEINMSMSCPEVISKLMDKECVQFDFSNDDAKEEPYEHTKLYLFESSVRAAMVDIVDGFRNVSLETRLYAVYKILEKAIEYFKKNELDYNTFCQEIALYYQENVLLSFEQQMKGVVNENSRLRFLKELQTVLGSIEAYGEYKEMLSDSIQYYQACEYDDYIRHLDAFRNVTAAYEQFYTNYWVSHIFADAMSIPNYEEARSKYIYIAAEFGIIQTIALAIFVKNGMKLSCEEYILIISQICRTMEHGVPFRKKLTELLNQNNAISAAGLLLMILK